MAKPANEIRKVNINIRVNEKEKKLLKRMAKSKTNGNLTKLLLQATIYKDKISE